MRKLTAVWLSIALWLAVAPATPAIDEQRARLAAEIATLNQAPCATQLEFIKAGLGTQRWWLTCPGCATVPVQRIFSPALVAVLERYAVSGRITATQLWQRVATCQSMLTAP